MKSLLTSALAPDPRPSPAKSAVKLSSARSRVISTMDERRRVSHLLRRAGFGATKVELDEYTRLGYAGAVDRLLDLSAPHTLDRAAAGVDLSGDPKVADLQHVWLTQMALTPRSLQEKMVLFWHGLLTSGAP